jgi:uncharacterized protein (UPF0332 family)
MIRNFEYYEEKNMVKKSMPNPSMARSLTEKARVRLKLLNEKDIPEETSPIIFEETYEAVREAAQSLMQLKGFKPYSHEAVIAFIIKEELMPERFTRTFDRYRILRNKSVYEAQKVSTETCKEALNFAKEEVLNIKNKLTEMLSKDSGN